MKVFAFIFEVIGWISITASITLAFGILGFLIYLQWNDPTGKAIATGCVILGIVLGAIWATVIWRKTGTINFLSRIRRIS